MFKNRNAHSRQSKAAGNGAESSGHVVVTGGAGFIGTNVADRLLSMGRRVVILDNLSRGGVDQNAAWLQQKHGSKVRIVIGDVRNREDVQRAVRGAAQVFHFAAQVAVTTSLDDPRADFEVNVGGTLNILEALREAGCQAPVLYTSTNKVYGGLDDIRLRSSGDRYEPVDGGVRARGVSEARALDFHTPYGCSKGAAEQYALDYARSFGLPAVVFRMSCIYGPHQFGTEDQGWVAHFLIRAMERKPITVYGDGKQVRDILFVDDLVDAMLLAQERIESTAGRAFNIGGGPERTISLLELLAHIRRLQGLKPRVEFESSRTGDQRYYVSDTSCFRAITGWEPRVAPLDGIERLNDWLAEARQMMARELAAS
jgi:CDP-paratose 2-epimerase